MRAARAVAAVRTFAARHGRRHGRGAGAARLRARARHARRPPFADHPGRRRRALSPACRGASCGQFPSAGSSAVSVAVGSTRGARPQFGARGRGSSVARAQEDADFHPRSNVRRPYPPAQGIGSRGTRARRAHRPHNAKPPTSPMPPGPRPPPPPLSTPGRLRGPRMPHDVATDDARQEAASSSEKITSTTGRYESTPSGRCADWLPSVRTPSR